MRTPCNMAATWLQHDPSLALLQYSVLAFAQPFLKPPPHHHLFLALFFQVGRGSIFSVDGTVTEHKMHLFDRCKLFHHLLGRKEEEELLPAVTGDASTTRQELSNDSHLPAPRRDGGVGDGGASCREINGANRHPRVGANSSSLIEHPVRGSGSVQRAK